MTKTIVIIVALLLAVGIGGIIALAAIKPDVFRVVRATTIKARPEAIFPLIEDFRRWGAWSPYEQKDPAMKRTYSGAAHGKGAVYAWEGDRNVGAGSMEITETSPPSMVTFNLDFTRPFTAHNVVTFTLAPKGDSTQVTWAMEGPVPFMAKVMHVFVDMDRMVGKDFEAGLANMKAAAERES